MAPKNRYSVAPVILVILALAGCDQMVPQSVDYPTELPWRLDQSPPALCSLHLGARPAELATLGAPDTRQELSPTSRSLTYRSKQLTLIATDADGVAIVYCRDPQSAEIEGMRIGDPVKSVIETLGTPDIVARRSGPEPIWLYSVGVWNLTVKFKPGEAEISEFGVGWNERKWSDSAVPGTATGPRLATRTLPFTRDENSDGARWIWFVLNQSITYPYTPTKDIPQSGLFQEIPSPVPGDIVWSPAYAAFVDNRLDQFITAEGVLNAALFQTRFGTPRYFRPRA